MRQTQTERQGRERHACPANDQYRRDHDQHGEKIGAFQLDRGDLQPNQQEEQRVQCLLDQAPEGREMQARPFAHRLRHAVIADDDAGDDHGDRSGHTEHAREAVSAGGQCQRNDQLDIIVVDPAQQLEGEIAEAQPEQSAAHRFKQKKQQHLGGAQRHRRDAGRDRQHQREQHNADAVIEQALAGDRRLQGPWNLAQRRELLRDRLQAVAAKASQDRLEDVRFKGATFKIAPLVAVTPETAEALADRLYGLMPRIRITDLLDDVATLTGFCDSFTHLRTELPAEDHRVVLTAVLADATNLGLTRMAEACTVASYKQLVWTAGWHLREDTYGQALAKIVEAQQRQPLAERFGSGTVSSSDGQNFPLAGRGESIGAVNPHKGSEPASGIYTHLSDRYAPFHTKPISVSEGEAIHVLDGLLYHGADLEIAIHHTDGGGVSDHLFALCHLLGFRFAPRIPNLQDRRLHTFSPASQWPVLEPFIAGRIDEGLIAAHWEDVLRLATSVRTGTVPASLMMRRLGSYPRQNGLALALREIGRIERTLFTLDWLEDPALRRQATAELNKGESRNSLARAVCFHRLGRLHDRTYESRQHRASGLNLVVAAIIFWNTVYLGRAVDTLRRQGEIIPDELLPHLAPLGWQHINLTGDYLWTPTVSAVPDGFRQLRGIPASVAA
jgi:TnpA family transposase